MSAVNLKINWHAETRESHLPFSTSSKEALFRRTGIRSAATECPVCGSIVYSKRHKFCGVCGRELPEACRFSTNAARVIESLIRAEKERHRAWLRRAEAD